MKPANAPSGMPLTWPRAVRAGACGVLLGGNVLVGTAGFADGERCAERVVVTAANSTDAGKCVRGGS